MRALCIPIFLFISAIAGGEPQRLTFGKYHSRAIFDVSPEAQCPAPLVVLVPGSGANGPEEESPASNNGDGRDHSIFEAYSAGLRRAPVGTLAIGKPGIDFFSGWDQTKWFYDRPLYVSAGWQDLVDNLAEAVAFANNLPCVDGQKLAILGHSEGTQVAVDYASAHPGEVKSLILVGFAGESLGATIEWQLFHRPIDSWLVPDVDTDHDGFISKTEAASWPEFQWPWQAGQEKVAISDYAASLLASESLQKEYAFTQTFKVWEGVYRRPPIYEQAAGLTEDLHVFTGALDVQTRPEQALRLGEECVKRQKQNCQVTLMPGLGHGMSQPKAPRRQKLLDMTLAPVDESFLSRLETTARLLIK